MEKLKLSKKFSTKLQVALKEFKIPKDSRDNLKAKQQRVFIASQMNIEDLEGQKRLPDEDYDTYRERLRIENIWSKMKRQGSLTWVAVDNQYEEVSKGVGYWVNKGGGTYEVSKHGYLDPNDEKKAKKLANRKLKNLAKEALSKKGK